MSFEGAQMRVPFSGQQKGVVAAAWHSDMKVRFGEEEWYGMQSAGSR